MKLITLSSENLDKEHICCAISDKKGDCQISSKKQWLSSRFNEGLVFTKADVRGKVFIEYIPAEYAWYPVNAPGYMFINCFWVSGQYKGQGLATLLLGHCTADSKEKGMQGLVTISSEKKMPFLSDPSYLKHKGFLTADKAQPFFQLMYLPFNGQAAVPSFKECAKQGETEDSNGFVLYYTSQCPYNAKYVPLVQAKAEQQGAQFKAVHIQTTKDAQNAPCPFTTYGLFYNGKFVTNEILSEKKFEEIVKKKLSLA